MYTNISFHLLLRRGITRPSLEIKEISIDTQFLDLPGVLLYLMTVFPFLLYTHSVITAYSAETRDLPGTPFMPVGGGVTTYFRCSVLLLKPI